MSGDDRNTWSERDILIRLQVQMDELIKNVKDTKNDHETRLRRLEERKFPLPTIAVLTSVAALAATIVMYVTNH
jgi:glutamate dehydrogenase/leucine dehydrogenase